MDKDLQLVIGLLERVESKVDKIQEVQVEQGKVLARNTLIVDQHEARSTKLEDWVSKLNASYTQLEIQFKENMKANEKVINHINTLNKFAAPFKAVVPIAKFILLISSVIGVLYAAFVFLSKGAV